jgi:hypothetical protein
MSDTGSGTLNVSLTNSATGAQFGTTYAAFPTATPAVIAGQNQVVTVTITLSANFPLVNEPQQDGTTTYVYDSTVNHADFYNTANTTGSTPVSVVAVTTRGFIEKSDAGTRSAAVQLKSGTATVSSPSTAISTTFGWLWRTDTIDPNTGSTWAPAAVDSAQVGPIVTV